MQLLEPQDVIGACLSGLGATLAIDVWALALKRGFNIPSLSYCLLGRWLLHMPTGTFVHASISAASPKRHECIVGWVAHYLIGTTLALVFIVLVSGAWLERPTLLPALAFGIVTVLIPYLVMQPAIGLGIAGSRTPRPAEARIKSLATHAVFGFGLYGWGFLLSHLLFRD